MPTESAIGDDGMVQLLVVVNIFYPDRGGGAAVFSDMCYALAERGIDVTVQCAYPYYPEWKDKSNRNGWRIWRYEDKGVKVERHGLFIPGQPNSLWQRLLYEASFFFSLLRSLPRRRKGFDVIMVYCPLVGAVAYATLIKLVHKIPIWLNVQDLSAEAAEASEISKSRALNHIFQFVQRFLFNKADVWSTISPVMIARLECMRKQNQPLLYLPNWVNASLAERINTMMEKVGRSVSSPVNLLYAGNIGKKQDLLRFCEVLRQSDALFEFRIYGNGGEAKKIQHWIQQSGDARFQFGPFLGELEFAQALQHADLFVITEKQGSGGSFIPSKLIPGIMSASPILAVCDGASPLGQEIRNTQCGPWFSWSQLSELSDFISDLPNRPDEYVTWQKNAIARVAFYDRDNIISQYMTELHNIATGRCFYGAI